MIRVSDSEINKMFDAHEDAKKARAEKMPDEQAALSQLQEAYTRLEELGWSNAVYSPKDGSMFSAVCAGSTGVHKCNYTGEWPKGSWWLYDGDVYPASPILWRARKDDDPEINLGVAKPF